MSQSLLPEAFPGRIQVSRFLCRVHPPLLCCLCLWQLALSPHPEQPKYWASRSHANTVQDDCPATPTPAVTNTAQVTGRACTWPPAADPETQGSAAACPPKPADTGLQGQDFLLGWGRVSEVPSPPLRRGQELPRNTQSPKVQPQFIHSSPRSSLIGFLTLRRCGPHGPADLALPRGACPKSPGQSTRPAHTAPLFTVSLWSLRSPIYGWEGAGGWKWAWATETRLILAGPGLPLLHLHDFQLGSWLVGQVRERVEVVAGSCSVKYCLSASGGDLPNCLEIGTHPPGSWAPASCGKSGPAPRFH